jgi:hypothetical protein
VMDRRQSGVHFIPNKLLQDTILTA